MNREPVRREAAPDGTGFTLIELLVVVAIVTLLLAILLPALGAARRWANLVYCQGSLRHLVGAWHTYFDDHEGRFYHDTNAEFLYGGWQGTMFPTLPRPLNPYVRIDPVTSSEKDARMFKCPRDLEYYHNMGTGYMTNILLIGDYVIAGTPDGDLQAEINKRLPKLRVHHIAKRLPAQLLLIGDYGWGLQWLSPDPPYGPGPYWHDRPYWYNVAFLDGHVRFLHIRKGILIDDVNDYTVLPFEDLRSQARDKQKAVPTP